MNYNNHKPKIHKINTLVKSNVFTIEEIELEFSNGNFRTYERLKPLNREAVMIIPVIDDNLLLIREYGVGIENYDLGFPKGLVGVGENLISAANRELMEEVGFGADNFIFLKRLIIAPAYFSSVMNVLIANDLYPNVLEGDEPEVLQLIRWPVSKMLDLLHEPEFYEARNVSALFLFYLYELNYVDK